MSTPAPQGPGSDRRWKLEHRHVVVAGFGVVGRMITTEMDRIQVNVTLIETNAKTIDAQRDRRHRVVHGDVRDHDVLRAAEIERADALILTIPNEAMCIEACAAARELHPGLFIAARTNFFSRGLMASVAGADAVVIEEVVTAEAMSQMMVDRLES